MKKDVFALAFISSLLLLSGCNTNHPTGSASSTLIGAGIGAGGVGLFGGSKAAMVLGGLGGGAVGYYVSTLRYDSGGVIRGGGEVYKKGDFIGIYIPTDQLFEPNTAEFLPQATPILDSAADVLRRYPNNNILVSGNSSGFGRPRWEQRLSEQRAKAVAGYFWNQGINEFREHSIDDSRKLNYVGYGDYFPLSSNYTNDGIRTNSRIQITSYPSYADLGLSKCQVAFRNIAETKDTLANYPGGNCAKNCKR